MEQLLTVSDLAKRWQKNERTIRKYIEDGTIIPCKGVPGVMFSQQYIAKLEGIEIEKHSVFEFRKLANENEALKKQNEELKLALREYQVISAKSLNLLT